jgi:hypothetical protein
MVSKYQIGDKLRWLGAPDEVLAIGEIFNIWTGDLGKTWYQITWDVVEPKTDYQPTAHSTPVLVIDESDDIRLVTEAERVLYLENKV